MSHHYAHTRTSSSHYVSVSNRPPYSTPRAADLPVRQRPQASEGERFGNVDPPFIANKEQLPKMRSVAPASVLFPQGLPAPLTVNVNHSDEVACSFTVKHSDGVACSSGKTTSAVHASSPQQSKTL